MPGRASRLLSFPCLAIAFLANVLTGGPPLAAAEDPVRAAFSGSWKLVEGLSRDPSAEKIRSDPASGASEQTMRSGRMGAGSLVGGMELPLEVLGDVHRLAVVETASGLRITYPSGRKRTFFTDGEERELDDGDGPAKVVAKRSGARGERIVVTSKWPTKQSLRETWELMGTPARLVVEGKVDGRESFRYRRVYEPAPLQAEGAAPNGTVPAAPSPTTAPAPSAPLPKVSRTDCAIRPPKGTRPEALRALATVSEADARKSAASFGASLSVTSVISSDPEVDEGCLVWPFILRLSGRTGALEVLVDAGDGKVLVARSEDP